MVIKPRFWYTLQLNEALITNCKKTFPPPGVKNEPRRALVKSSLVKKKTLNLGSGLTHLLNEHLLNEESL